MEIKMLYKNKHTFFFYLTILMILALITRVIILYEFLNHNPFSQVFFSDDWVYWVMAGAKAAGNWIEETPFLSAPLFPYLLGLVRWLGGSLVSVYVVQLLLGLASIYLLAVGTKRRFGENAGLLAAGLFIFAEEPTMTFTRVMADSLQIFLITLVWFLWTRLSVHSEENRIHFSLTQIIITGALIGLLVLAWPPAQLLLITYGVWLFFIKDISLQKKLLYSFCGIISGFLIISPVTIHNYKTDGEFILVSANSGINLLQGNNKNATGIITPISGIRTDRQHMFDDAKNVFIQTNGEDASWKKIDNYYKDQAINFIFDQPLKSSQLLLKKFYWFLSSQDYDNISVLSLEQKHGLYQWAKLTPIELPWLMGLAFSGLLLLIKNIHRNTPELAILATTIIACVLFHYSARYRLPAAPIIFILSAVALTRWKDILLPSIIKFIIVFLPLTFILINSMTGFASVEFMRKDTAIKISHAYVEAGDQKVRFERYQLANENYVLGVEADQNYETPYLRLAHLGLKNKQPSLTRHWVKKLQSNSSINSQTKITGYKILFNAQLLDQKYRAASETLEHLINLTPNDLKLQQNLIWLLATNPDPASRNPEKALDLARQLLASSTGSGRVGALVTLAVAQLSKDDKQSASGSIEKAIKMARRLNLEESIETLISLANQIKSKQILDFSPKLFSIVSPWDLTKPHPMELIEY
ncbi:MAG: glycosyltransferase family 39 protein [Gammaproteobacteria bacterium]